VEAHDIWANGRHKTQININQHVQRGKKEEYGKEKMVGNLGGQQQGKRD